MFQVNKYKDAGMGQSLDIPSSVELQIIPIFLRCRDGDHQLNPIRFDTLLYS